MAVQLAPWESQSCHWYAMELGAPVQLPGAAVSVLPTEAIPDIDGAALDVGATDNRYAAFTAVAYAEIGQPFTAR